jgi:hypothetical protein
MGGAERVVSRLSNYWCRQGHDIAIATVYSYDSDFYKLDSRIKLLLLIWQCNGILNIIFTGKIFSWIFRRYWVLRQFW